MSPSLFIPFREVKTAPGYSKARKRSVPNRKRKPCSRCSCWFLKNLPTTQPWSLTPNGNVALGRIKRGVNCAVRILPPAVNFAALLIATCDLSRSVDRIGEAISPVAWNDDRRRDSPNIRERRGEHRLAGIVTDKVAHIIHAVDDRIIRAVNIEFRKDAPVE